MSGQNYAGTTQGKNRKFLVLTDIWRSKKVVLACLFFIVPFFFTVPGFCLEPVVLDHDTLNGSYIGSRVEYISEKKVFQALLPSWESEAIFKEKILSGKFSSDDHIALTIKDKGKAYQLHMKSLPAGKHEAVFSWGIEDLLRLEDRLAFQPSSNEIFAVWFDFHAVWLRFDVENPTPENIRVILEYDRHFTGPLDLFIPYNGKVVWKKGGFDLKLKDREIPHRNTLFPIELAPGVTTCYLRVDSPAPADMIPLRIWTQQSLSGHRAAENMINGIIVGIMVAIFIYGIFIFLSLRNFNYLFLSLIAVAQLFEHLSISGFGFQYLWPGNPALGFHVLNVTLILTCMIILLFFRAFLEISTYTPGVDRILKVMIGLFFAILCCYLIFSHIRFRIAVLSLVLFLMQFYYLPLFVPAVKAVKRKDRTGIFVIIGLVILLGSQVEWFLSTFNIIPYNLIHFIQVKGIALLMVMTLGLAVKIKRMRVSLEDLNTGLEKKVLKRTRELRQKSVELKQANDRLQELDHLKTKFFTNISHELRTPLTLISAPVKSFIKGDYGRLTKRNTEILKMVEKNTHRLTKLINDLLDYSKIEAGKMDLKKETCDISSFAAYCLSCVEPAAESMDIHVELEDRTPGIHIPIDRELMEKAMFNLLQNAVKFNRPGGLIHLLLEAGEEEYRIVITDTGIGIPADKIHLIFERFSQVDSSLAKKYEGTGIGLSLTKEVVEMHGGKIKVESTEGQGTTFCLTLPMEGIVVHGNNEKEPVRARSSDKATLVIAEDNGDLRKYLEGMLKKTYHVLLCKNGRTALEKISHTPVDLVIADIMMPEMDGLELLRAIRSGENNRTLPVLLLTARSGIRDKVEGLETGANDYITKPFHPDELLARVKAHLRLNDLRAKLQLNDRSKKSVTEKTKARIEIIKQFIREKYDQNFSMKDLGLAAGMSPGHLGRMFKQDTGEKISDYTSRIRIEKACEMVVQTDKKIIDIAFSVGFESLRTFNMAFSDIRGCSPTQYRRKYSHE